MRPLYRADHVGRLLRPEELDAESRPQITRDELTRLEDTLTEGDQWRKLQLIVETARKVWKDA